LWGGESLASNDCRFLLTMEQSGDLVLSGTENEHDDPCLDRTNEGCRRRRRLTNIWYDVWNSNTSHIMADQSGESVPKFTINADGTMSIWEFMDQNASSNSARLLWTQNTNVSGNDLVLTLNAGGCLSLIHNEADSVGTEWTFCGSFIWRRTTTLSVDQNGLGDDNKIESNDGEKKIAVDHGWIGPVGGIVFVDGVLSPGPLV